MTASKSVAHDAAAPPLTLIVSAEGSSGNFALQAVERTTKCVGGMANRAGGDLMEVHQLTGEVTVVTVVEEQDPHRDWEFEVKDSPTTGDPPMDGANHDVGDRAPRRAVGGRGDNHYHEHPPGYRRHHHCHQRHAADLLAGLQLDLVDNARAGPLGRQALYPTELSPYLHTY